MPNLLEQRTFHSSRSLTGGPGLPLGSVAAKNAIVHLCMLTISLFYQRMSNGLNLDGCVYQDMYKDYSHVERIVDCLHTLKQCNGACFQCFSINLCSHRNFNQCCWCGNDIYWELFEFVVHAGADLRPVMEISTHLVIKIPFHAILPLYNFSQTMNTP